jgi:bifunctional non-homologous end joining protein LigD
MLATQGPLPLDEAGWAFEVKWDGVRALAYADGNVIVLESRNLLDITPRYPEVAALTGVLGDRQRAVIDGEVVAFGADGRPSFERLQSRMHVASAGEVRRRMAETPVVYFMFDILWLDGRWLLDEPYRTRRSLLEETVGERVSSSLQLSPSHQGEGAALLEATAHQGLEGIVAKQLDSPYQPGHRSRSWIKVKHLRRQELVVCGWLPGEGGRTGRIGALVLGYFDEAGELRYAGRVGTGFTTAELDRLGRRLSAMRRAVSPFPTPIPDERLAVFVDPVLVAEVAFREWTAAGVIRQASYQGLREDKEPREVRRDT